MGLMGLLLKSSVECLDIFAWPLFALGYPLCASIRAIETNSNSDTRKLITYWVCFSLILLFEHACGKLVEWLPYWPYIKLLIVGFLVTPYFDGSLYVYEHLVHPCLSMNPCIVFNWLIKLLELLKQDDLLLDAKREAKETEPKARKKLREAKETEPKAREKLIAVKPKLEQPKVVQKDTNAVEITDNKEVPATKQVTQVQRDDALSGRKTCAPAEIKEMTEALLGGGKDHPGIPYPKAVQKEWTCAVCQVTTTCEADLISHLQGKRHEDACAKLKAKNQLSKNKISSSVETGGPRNKEIGTDLPNEEHLENVIKPSTSAAYQETVTSEADHISVLQGMRQENVSNKKKASNQTSPSGTLDSVDTGSALEIKETDMTSIASNDICEKQNMTNVQRMWTPPACLAIGSIAIDYTSNLQEERHGEAFEKLKAKDHPSKSNISSLSAETGARPNSGIDKPHSKGTQQSWTCAACKVTTNSKIDLVSHFNGQRHAEGLEKLKANPNSNSSFEPWTCGICKQNIHSEKDLIKHLEGKRHMNACKEFKVLKKTATGEASSASSLDLRSKPEVAEVKDSKWWWCDICNISCSGEGNMMLHLKGSKHLARTRELGGAAAGGQGWE